MVQFSWKNTRTELTDLEPNRENNQSVHPQSLYFLLKFYENFIFPLKYYFIQKHKKINIKFYIIIIFYYTKTENLKKKSLILIFSSLLSQPSHKPISDLVAKQNLSLPCISLSDARALNLQQDLSQAPSSLLLAFRSPLQPDSLSPVPLSLAGPPSRLALSLGVGWCRRSMAEDDVEEA